MDGVRQARIDLLEQVGGVELLGDYQLGVEKESLRVAPDGRIAQTPHPRSLGSTLTHPTITTDYSEALLELITPPFGNAEEARRCLIELHCFVYQNLQDEILWAGSMPCILGGEESIPIAEYGSSNAGFMKHVYRRGLGYRYGRTMQVIAGVHFNFSLSERLWQALYELEDGSVSYREFVASAYFGMIRNLQRLGWLVPYLFGASPAACKSFFGGKADTLQAFDASTRYLPFATSLRVSDIGYQNRKEKKGGLQVCYDGLQSYVKSLQWAVHSPYPDYEKIGVCVDGDWRQLNANVLQIENEYYSSIRPKQPFGVLEMPSDALLERGVRYVELRSLDLNPFDPVGVDESTLRFLTVFLTYCALCDSPLIDAEERAAIDRNLHLVATQGRDPALRLCRCPKGDATVGGWGREVLEAMAPVSDWLDRLEGGDSFTRSRRSQGELLEEPDATPSARVLAEMRARGEDYFEYTMRLSREHARTFHATALTEAAKAELSATAERSLVQQRELEQSDRLSFRAFLDRYFKRA